MALEFEADPTFAPGTQTQLFEWDFVGGGTRRMAVSRDGQRVLLLKRVTEQAGIDGATAREIHVVINWFQHLQSRVPVP